MTATERIRAMLDERGVEYIENDFGITWSYYNDPHTATESMDGTLIVTGLTPEQAIEATLGRGECRNLITHIQGQMPMLHCEECGCTTTLNVPSGGAGYVGETEMVWPLYCANCGRAVRA